MSVTPEELDRASALIRLHHIDPRRVSVCSVDFTTSRLCDHGNWDCGRATCCVLVASERDVDYLCARCAVQDVRGWLTARPDEPVIVMVSW